MVGLLQVGAGSRRDDAPATGRPHQPSATLVAPGPTSGSRSRDPSGAATCVIACKLDRLFRNTADALTLTESWNRSGVALHLLDLNVDTSTTMGRFFLSIIAAAAELERSMGADRTRAALDQVKAQGGRLGRDAHGWRRLDAVDDCGRRVVESVPGELAAVERAVELRSGATLAAVAEALNREGLPTKRGAVWRAGTVRAVLGRITRWRCWPGRRRPPGWRCAVCIRDGRPPRPLQDAISSTRLNPVR